MKTAVLLVNLGSPDAPTKEAVRPYLAEFLSDPRVIDWPRWQWLPILYGIVLNIRPKKTAHAYQEVWTEEGSPLLKITKDQTEAVQKALPHLKVDYAMRYGNPSIKSKIHALKAEGIERILVVPMYPQYSDSTVATVFDEVANSVKKMRGIPEFRFIHHWYDRPKYTEALARTIREYVAQHGMPEKILFSYHGVPKRYYTEGDPYYDHCVRTTEATAKVLNYPEGVIQTTFQSRFGSEEWLQPYTDKTVEALGQAKCQHLAIISPAFSADCLETLEEISGEAKEIFQENGGGQFGYIPALNSDPDHIELLVDIIKENLWIDAQS